MALTYNVALSFHSFLQIEDELDLATASFLENPEGVAVDAESETVVLSKLFQWYRADFGESTNAMVKWVKKRVKDEVRKLQQEYKYVVGYSDNRILPQLYNSVMI